MMKKFCMKLATTTAGALLILAAPGQANPGIQSGPYAGASIGLSNLSGKQTFTRRLDADPAAGTDLPLSLSKSSLAASLFAGYGHKWNCYWFGGEIGYNFDRLNATHNLTVISARNPKAFAVKSTGAWEADFHFGYLPQQNIVIYAIAGIELRRFRSSFQDQANPVDIAPQINKSYMSTAFVPGLGGLVKLSKNLSLRGEYKCALHRSKTFTAAAPNLAVPGSTDSISLKTAPWVHSFKVGFVYSF